MQGPISRIRSAVATTAANLATTASRATGRGAGGMIGGLVAGAIDPNIMASLGGGRPVALVTGTNGKSTTVRLLAAMVGAAGQVAGLSSSDWVRVGDDILDRGDYSGPSGARFSSRFARSGFSRLSGCAKRVSSADSFVRASAPSGASA